MHPIDTPNNPPTPIIVANYHCHTGENPLWNPVDQRLYWCDIPCGRLFRYNPLDNTHELCFETEPIGGFTIEADGALVLFMARGTVRRWHKGAFNTILPDIPKERDSRFNDVLADPLGRVFCGTMATPRELGRLYRLDPDGTLTVMLEEVQCSNGLAFSVDRGRLFYTDSWARKIYVFDYHSQDGSLSKRRVFADCEESDGFPDGLTVDASGGVWSARWDAGCLIRYTQDGLEERRISLPTAKVSSLTFGGPSYSDLYITTAGGDDPAANGENAGALFRMKVGFRGVPECFSRFGVS